MSTIAELSPMYWATCILISASVFSIAWFLDALTHQELVEVDITDKELQTHRIILAGSMLMELALVTMYWFDWEVLPFFIAFFFTRTAHEVIDELHYHTDRCSPYESYLHLTMWISVISKTACMFIWGFFTHYDGIWELPWFYYLWAVLAFGLMGWTSLAEWGRGKGVQVA